jgi:cyclase
MADGGSSSAIGHPSTAHQVFTHGGTKPTGLQTVAWATEVYNRGAGEILLTSMNSDGTRAGFAIDITKQVCEAINIPVIASGGAGNMEHFKDVFENGKADAALAASIFHFGEVPIPTLKKYLNQNKIPVRI